MWRFVHRGVPEAAARKQEDKKTLEFLYIILEVQTKLYRGWIIFFLLPLIFNCCCGALAFLYIPIRHPEMPIMMNVSLLVLAATILTVILWVSVEFVLVVRGSEEVLGKLSTFEEDWRRDFSVVERLRFLKRAKACRPVEVPVGTFGAFSLDVPIIICDEILNQLIFLLSF